MKDGPPHQCPVADCQVQVPHNLLMCSTHWRMVPHAARRLVDKTWNFGRGYGTPEHRDACRQAIDAVNAAQGKGPAQ